MISKDCRSQIFEKKNCQPEFGPKVPKSFLKLVFFCHFLKFCSLVFCETAYNNGLRQCLTFSGVKTNKIFLAPKFGPNKPKSGPKLVSFFFFHFLTFGSLVFLDFAYNDSLQQFLTNIGKTHRKKLEGLKLGFRHFLNFASLVFLDVVPEMIFSILMLSNISSNLLVMH